MQPTRRDFLRLGLGSSVLLASGTMVPAFVARSALAAGAAADAGGGGRVLVVIQLTGGNDGLNTVVPYRDEEYRRHRPKLQVGADSVLKIDDRVGLHPALTGFSKLLEGRQLAVVQGVGYPNPNRSHFESMATWHTARLNADPDTPGWLVRSLESWPRTSGRDAPALHIGGELLPQALTGGDQQVPSLTRLEQFRWRLGVPEAAGAREQRAALDEVAGLQRGQAGSLLQFVERSFLLTHTSSARLEGLVDRSTARDGYPDSGLARRLRLIALLIKAELSTCIYYTALDGFDTHAYQPSVHESLLRELGDALQAFVDDLTRAGHGKRVLALVFSEFGRRVKENASLGTDHGTAAPLFLLGGGVKAGLHEAYPDLQDLDDGDLKQAIDFRRVYATVLVEWLNCPSARVLGGTFARLPLLENV
jgi:uncharacterized protein (DUF1501 family)